jgi:DHA1 family tetracycline resistance protein-like MFS transporter
MFTFTFLLRTNTHALPSRYAIFGLAFSIGPALGGIVAERFGVRWALQLACALFLLNAACVSVLLPASAPSAAPARDQQGVTAAAVATAPSTEVQKNPPAEASPMPVYVKEETEGEEDQALGSAPLAALQQVWTSLSPGVQRLLMVDLCISWSTMLLRSSVSLLLEYKNFGTGEISVKQKGFVISVFSIVGMLAQLVVVPRVARLAPEMTLVAFGAVAVAVGACGVALASTIELMYAALAVVAVGSAVLDSNYHSVLTKTATNGRFGVVIGLSATVESATRALSPFASGVLLEMVGPGAPAAVAAVFAVFTAVCAVRILAEPQVSKKDKTQ